MKGLFEARWYSVLDDHQLVRDGLTHVREGCPDLEVVGEAGSLAEAVKRVQFDEPGVVIMDVDLPDRTGVEACRRIRQNAPQVRVLMLTAYADTAALAAAREAGAAGFLLKRIRNLELVEAIRRVGRGGEYFDDAPPKPDQENELLARLSPRELTILEQVAQGKTNREIAESLYLAEKTVKNYVSNLLMKMGLRHRAGAAAHFVSAPSRGPSMHPPTEWSERNKAGECDRAGGRLDQR